MSLYRHEERQAKRLPHTTRNDFVVAQALLYNPMRSSLR